MTVAGVHRFGNFDINAVAGRRLARADRDDDAPGGDALHPDGPGDQALDPGSARREPVPAVPLLLRQGDVVVLAAARARRRRVPDAAAARGDVDEPRSPTRRGDAAAGGQPVYAFNTDSMAGLAMVNQLLGQGASVSRGAAAFDSGGVHFATGAALVDGASVRLATIAADAAQWQTPVFGLGRLPGRPLRADGCRRSACTPAARPPRRTRRSTGPATASAPRRPTARRCSTSRRRRGSRRRRSARSPRPTSRTASL